MAEANDRRALDAENTWKKAVQDRVQQCANTKGPQGGGAKGDKEAQVKAQKELVEELVKEQYMSFTKEHLDAYKKYRDGKDNLITFEELMFLFPGALKPTQHYTKGVKATLKSHVEEFMGKVVTLTDVHDIMVKMREGISKEIKHEVQLVYDLQESKFKAVTQKFQEQDEKIVKVEKLVKIGRYINREILIYPYAGGDRKDWGPEIEGDHKKLKTKAHSILSEFVRAHDKRKNFIERVSMIPTKPKDNAKDFKRYRVICTTDAIASDILEYVETECRINPGSDMRKYIKPGKMPYEREVSEKRWPLSIAAHHFNFQSQTEGRTELVRIEMNEDTKEWELVKYPSNHKKVTKLLAKLERKEFKPPKDYLPETHSVYLLPKNLKSST